jgi:uncharacterized protein (DUF736 family)
MDGRLPIALRGDETLCDQPRPSHRIATRARDGSMIDTGAAWLKTTRHGPQKGKQFLSIQIDNPERAAAMNVAAFPDEKTGEWVIVWRRRSVAVVTAS